MLQHLKFVVKYGHDIKDGNMRLTLLKSTCDPNPDADKEEHFFTYSIYPHTGTWKEAKTVNQAYQLNTPLFTKVCEENKGILDNKLSLASVNKDNVMIEVIKKAEDSDDLIIRLYEFHNKRTNVDLSFFKNIESAVECNLLEDDLSSVNINGNSINFIIKPFEIKTLKVRLR